MESQYDEGTLKRGDHKENSDILNGRRYDNSGYEHIGPAAESLQVIVRITIIITVACRDYTVSPGERDVIPMRGILQVLTGQQTVNTDLDKDLTP